MGLTVKTTNGTTEYFLNGQLHREDGPAVERADGVKFYFIKGKLHREDGPAVEYPNGDKEYFINNKKIPEKDFCAIEKTINKIFCNKCNTTNEYAEPNQDDGSYICYNCR